MRTMRTDPFRPITTTMLMMLFKRVPWGKYVFFMSVTLQAAALAAGLEENNSTVEMAQSTIQPNTAASENSLLRTSVKKDAPKEYNSTLFATADSGTLEEQQYYKEMLFADIAPEQHASKTEANQQKREELDARSTFINNQYVADAPDEPTLQTGATAAPLYDLLQQQMQHVLAATAPQFTQHTHGGREASIEARPKHSTDNLQLPPSRPIFGFDNDDDGYEDENSSDYAEETEAETDAYPVADKVADYDRHEAEEGVLPYEVTPAPIVPTRKPIITVEVAPPPPPQHFSNVAPASMHAPSTMRPASGTMHHHKRRVNFKTVATASQFVATPLGDLMFKYSIGIAKSPAANILPFEDLSSQSVGPNELYQVFSKSSGSRSFV